MTGTNVLNLLSAVGDRDCAGITRRDFLRVGALGLGAAGLPGLSGGAEAAVARAAKDRSIVFLFLCGGPSQLETFAPNMDAPAPKCSLTGEIRTSLPGVTFGASFPRLARLAHRLAVVRSYSPHDIGDHAKAIHHVFTAGNPLLDASLGALVTRLGGAGLVRGMPAFTELVDDELDEEDQQDTERMRSSDLPGRLGPTCAPFAPDGSGHLNRDLRLSFPLERLEDRRALLRAVNHAQRRLGTDRAQEQLEEYQRQAVEVLTGGAVRRALDLKQEDPKVVRRYDTSHLETGWTRRRPSTLGRQLLLARRLCEAGCRFVTVGMAGWDQHGNGKHPGVVDGTHHLGRQVDHAVSEFLEDVQARGLSEKILLVMTGEFGRTTRIQAQGGRDHWPGICSLVFAGGGLRMGQVIGEMSRDGDFPASEPYRLDHLTGTLLHSMFDLSQLRLDTSLPAELLRMVEGVSPIRELF